MQVGSKDTVAPPMNGYKLVAALQPRFGGRQVPGYLIQGEPIERQIVVERINDPIPITPGLAEDRPPQSI